MHAQMHTTKKGAQRSLLKCNRTACTMLNAQACNCVPLT